MTSPHEEFKSGIITLSNSAKKLAQIVVLPRTFYEKDFNEASLQVLGRYLLGKILVSNFSEVGEVSYIELIGIALVGYSICDALGLLVRSVGRGKK